jgi:hypothetical protein
MTPTASIFIRVHFTQGVWPSPGKELLVDVERAVLLAIHHKAAVLTAILVYTKRHVMLALAGISYPGRIAFIDDM